MALQTRTQTTRRDHSYQQLTRAMRYVYHCSFCPDELRKNPLTLKEALLSVVGFRHHHCPHCFEQSLLPVSWLKVVLFPFFAIRQTARWILNRL
ncbi:MAG: hypothetical protein ACK50J_15245 [Planctomyces sp.]